MVLFRATCEWGRSAFRPLLIMLALVAMFLPFYGFAVLRPAGNAGIWRVWDSQIQPDAAQRKAERVCPTLSNAVAYGLYFSILSAFHIGWKELNIGSWIEQFSPYEYKLRGSGWARSVAGIQAIISVYLLALAALSYFGRPFE